MTELEEKGRSKADSHIQQLMQTSQQFEALGEPNIPHNNNSLAQLCTSVVELFVRLVRIARSSNDLNIARPDSISLERSASRLKLWSDGHGVASGDLNHVFDSSSTVRQTTTRALSSIAETLIARLIPELTGKTIEYCDQAIYNLALEVQHIVSNAEIEDVESINTSDSSRFSEDGLYEITEDLHTDTMYLVDLDPLLADPVLDSITELAAPHDVSTEWSPFQQFCDMVRTRYPEADKALVSKLGMINYERYIRCQQERESRELCTSSDGDEVTLPPEGSKFHDSGIGSSLPPASSYAQTVMSYGGGSGGSVRVPPLSAEAKSGQPFQCLACGQTIKARQNSEWKKHLYADLCPWVCVDLSCAQGNFYFASRDDWIHHLTTEHRLGPDWASFRCPLCISETGNGKLAIIGHIASHLEEISLAAIPPDFEDDESVSDESSQTTSESKAAHEGVSHDSNFDLLYNYTQASQLPTPSLLWKMF
ncbi:hypothetical protein PG985_014956 [Apiospora marii]|uniref:uncharacterized protein n=1 Tax=Apiospora marii TaxID=335849 RepID=UPI0031322693